MGNSYAMWPIVATEEFADWLEQLPTAIQEAVAAKLLLLQQFGPQLNRPHADTLKGSKHAIMKELVVDEGKQLLRIAFAFDPRRTGIVLIGGAKQGVPKKKFYADLIRQADRLHDEHLGS